MSRLSKRAALNAALAAALASAFTLAPLSSAHAAGTVVYCSEGSPEGFQPQFFTTGTTFDAASVPMFNRLVEFDLGTTNIVPGSSFEYCPSSVPISGCGKTMVGV